MQIRGCGTAIITPFRAGAVDLEALGKLVEAQIAGGVDFLVPCGTTGESPTLTDKERIAVIECTVDAAAGRVPVVAGTGTNDTQHSVDMTRAAKAAGADACLAVAPYYNKPTQDGLYRHFRAMIDDGGLPAMLYHIPGRSGIGIDVATVARTAAAGGVIGLKETEHVGRISALRDACDVPILSGDDGLTFPMICLGAVGVVSVTSNVVPAQIAALVRHALAGELDAARGVHEELGSLFGALFCETNPIPVKAAAHLLGLVSEPSVRLPLTTATEATTERLRKLLLSEVRA